jgi:hypothetical protein
MERRIGAASAIKSAWTPMKARSMDPAGDIYHRLVHICGKIARKNTADALYDGIDPCLKGRRWGVALWGAARGVRRGSKLYSGGEG